MFSIETERLQLIALDLECLNLLRQDRILLEKELDIEFSDHQLNAELKSELKKELFLRIEEIREFPDDYLWLTNWEIILKSKLQSIGAIGFKGKPDETGCVTIFYYIDERNRCCGYATEAIEMISDWAFQHNNLLKIIAETEQGNHASEKVLEKNGFVFLTNEDGLSHWQLTRK